MTTEVLKENISFSYEAMGNSSYLVASFQNGFSPINYQVEMLSANEIANILPANKHQKNAEIQIYYNVTSKLSLAQAVSRQKMSRDNFLNLILGAINAFKEVDEYQLVNTGIILDLNLVFVKTGTFEPAFVYLPIYVDDDGIKNLREFITGLILKDVVEVSNDNFVQMLLSSINSETLTLAELEKIALNLKKPTTGATNSVSYSINADTSRQSRPEPVFEPPKIPFAPTMSSNEKPSEQKTSGNPNIPGSNSQKKVDEKKRDTQGVNKSTVLNTSSKNMQLMIGVQVFFFILLIGLIFTGALMSEGSIDIKKVLGVFIGIGGIDYVVYRELFINNKDKDKTGKVEAAPTKANIPNQKPVITPIPQSAQPSVQIPVQIPVQQPKAQPIQPMVNRPAPVLSDDTVILGEDSIGVAYLEYFDNGISNKIILNKPSVLVGRLKGQVDYIINNNKVGKVHAEFISRDGSYFVKDYNSTNGTYINGNGQRISSNVEHQIESNDRIYLANSELIFKC